MLDPIDVFNTFKPHRGNAIVTAQGTAGRHWGDISDQPSRDISLGGAMGHTTSAAFGLALGLPDEKVVLFDAEGSLLMNLGVLGEHSGQEACELRALRAGPTSAMQRQAGSLCRTRRRSTMLRWQRARGICPRTTSTTSKTSPTSIEDIMQEDGPILIAIKVQPEIENLPIGLRERRVTRSRAETIKDLREELGIGA